MESWKDKVFEFFEQLKRRCQRYGWPEDDFETFAACWLMSLENLPEEDLLRKFKRGLLWALCNSFSYQVFKYFELGAAQERLSLDHLSKIVASGVFSSSLPQCFKRMRKTFVECVFQRSQPLLARMASNFVTPRIKLEDLMQEAAATLLEQFDKGYDPNRGRFLTMCNNQLRHRFIALQRMLNYQITFPVWVNKYVNAARNALVLGDLQKFEEALYQLAGGDPSRVSVYRSLLLASTNETVSLYKSYEEDSGRREEWLSDNFEGFNEDESVLDQWFRDAADYISELIRRTDDITLIEAWREFQELKGEFERLSEQHRDRLQRFILEELKLRPPYDPASETPSF